MRDGNRIDGQHKKLNPTTVWWESQDLPWVHRRRRTARWVCANSACRSLERSANRYGLHDTAGLRSNTYHPYARYLRAGKPLCPPPSMCARSEPRATPPSGEPPPTSQTADGRVGEGFGSVLVSIGVRDPSTWSTRPSIGSGRQPSGRKAAWFSKRILSDAVLTRKNGGRSGGAGRAIHRPGTHHGSCSSAFPGQALRQSLRESSWRASPSVARQPSGVVRRLDTSKQQKAGESTDTRFGFRPAADWLAEQGASCLPSSVATFRARPDRQLTDGADP